MPPKQKDKKTNSKKKIVRKAKNYIDSKSSSSVQNKIDKKIPLFVWFYADWCGHCTIMKQEWVQLAKKVADEKNRKTLKTVQLVRIESQYIDEKYHVSAYPTLRLYKHGKIHGEYLGDRDMESMIAYLRNEL